MTEPPAPFAPPETRRRRGIASQRLSVELATYAVVIATAVALVVYFALR